MKNDLEFKNNIWNMKMALSEAEEAYHHDEVPVGAVIIGNNGEPLAQGRNKKERANDPCGHAEIIAIRQAGEKNNGWRLDGTTLFVTLEPCPMCLNAVVHARINKLVFGAYDKKGGAISLGYHFHKDDRLNHSFEIVGGFLHYECSKILSKFFKEKRSFYKQNKDYRSR